MSVLFFKTFISKSKQKVTALSYSAVLYTNVLAALNTTALIIISTTASAAESVAELTAAANSNSVEFASKRKADIYNIYVRDNSKRASKIDNNNNLSNK